jgi:hypothetical protein
VWRLAFILLVGLSAVAQTPNCDSTVLPIRVMGVQSLISSETSKQLHVLLDGHEVVPRKIEFGTVARNTSILIDYNGTTRDPKFWKIAQDTARHLVTLTPGEVKVAAFAQNISRFAGRDEIAQNATLPLPDVQTGDQERHPDSLFKAVVAAVRDSEMPKADDMIVVLTDSNDETSSMLANKLLQSLGGHVRVFAVLIAPPADGIPAVLSGQTEFVDILTKSGGEITKLLPLPSSWDGRLADPAGMALAQKELWNWYTAIRSAFYVQLPPLAHATKVKVELMPKIKGARILYPHELPACTPHS